MNYRSHRTGFSRTDLLAAIVLSMVIFLYAGIITGCGGGAAERTRLRMLNGTQVRGLQMGMVLYAQGNKQYYPGLDSSGANLTNKEMVESRYRFTAADLSPADPTAAVYAALFTGNFYVPDYALNPLEPKGTKTKLTEPGTVTKANYSYALLSFASPDAVKGRRAAWMENQDSRTPIAGDRSKAIDPSLKTTSLHVSTTSTDSADWQGSIVWNDNHVTFEKSGKLKAAELKIGKVEDNQSTDIDDLFDGAAVGKFDATTNALFAY